MWPRPQCVNDVDDYINKMSNVTTYKTCRHNNTCNAITQPMYALIFTNGAEGLTRVQCKETRAFKSSRWKSLILFRKFLKSILRRIGPGSVVGIATGYGLDGPGIESRWRRDFPHLSRPALRPTQPPVQWYRVFLGGKKRPGRDAGPSPTSSAVGHERVELYLYSPHGPYGLYTASVPVQGSPLALPFLPLCRKSLLKLYNYDRFSERFAYIQN